jgi:drug/metabolite transporter (DMT)-like permease
MVVLMRKPFYLGLVIPCFIVFLGCAMCSKSDPTYTLFGLLLAAGANVPRSLKAVLQQLLMQKEENSIEHSPLEVLAWTCVPSAFVMFCGSILQEGTAPYLAFRSVERSQAWHLVGAIFLSCVNACILNSANLFGVKDLGAVGSQIVAQTKALLVVLGGMSMLGEDIPRMEFAGFLLVMVGVFMYNDMEARFKAKDKPENASIEEKQPLLVEKIQQVAKEAENKQK